MRFFKTIGSLSCVAALLCSYGVSTEKTRTATYSHQDVVTDGGQTETTTGVHTGTKFQNDSNSPFVTKSWSDVNVYGDEEYNFSGPKGGTVDAEYKYGGGSYSDSPSWTQTVEGVSVYNPVTGSTFTVPDQSFQGYEQPPTQYHTMRKSTPTYDSATNTVTRQGSFGSASYNGTDGTVDLTGNGGTTYDLYNPNWVGSAKPGSRESEDPFKDLYTTELEGGTLGQTTGTLTWYTPTTGEMETATSSTTRTYDVTTDDSYDYSYDVNTNQTWDY